MSAKHGNDCERQRQRIEDRIIRRIDEQPWDPLDYRDHGPLRISILELVCFKAATTGVPVMRGG